MREQIVYLSGLIAAFVFINLLVIEPVSAQSNTIEVTTSSEDARQLFIEGKDLTENYELVKAKQKLTKALALDEDLILARVYLQAGKVHGKELKALYEKLDKQKNRITEGEYLLGNFILAYQDGNKGRMIENINQLIKRYPNDPSVNFYRATVYNFYQDDPERALIHLNKAIDINEDYAQAYNTKAYVYMDQKMYGLADEYFKKYIELRPQYGNSYDSYGEYLFEKGDYDEAMKYFEKSLKMERDYFTAYQRMGDVYFKKHQYDKAIESYNQYIQLEQMPLKVIEAMNSKVNIYILENNIDKVMATFDEIVKVAEVNNLKNAKIMAMASKGLVFKEFNHHEEAKQCYDEAIAFGQDNDMKNWKPSMCGWKIICMAGNTEVSKCEQILKDLKNEAEKSGSYDVYAFYESMKGYYHLKKGEYVKACRSFENGLNSPPTWYYLGLAQLKLKNNELASKYFNKLKEHNENDLYGALYLAKAKNENYIQP